MQSTEKPLVNRVEQSGLVVLDIADLLPSEKIEEVDLKQFLVKELVLMEKPFREAISSRDWSAYSGKFVTVFCSNDALIPMWAYMLVTSALVPQAKRIFFGNRSEAENHLLKENLENIDLQKYAGAKVVIKGCGDKPLHPSAFVSITQKLLPVVQSLMYGEPCSTVPVYKKPKS